MVERRFGLATHFFFSSSIVYPVIVKMAEFYASVAEFIPEEDLYVIRNVSGIGSDEMHDNNSMPRQI